ncbi:MAG: hypothetical protein SPE33_00745 [[Pasteurella] aerogenes]|nr:hypothetical protein [[Pasteurella] aerogenes]
MSQKNNHKPQTSGFFIATFSPKPTACSNTGGFLLPKGIVMNLNPLYHLRRYRELEWRNTDLVKRVSGQLKQIEELRKEKKSLETQISALRKEVIEKENRIIQLSELHLPKAVAYVSKSRKEKRGNK